MIELFRRLVRLPPGASSFADGVDRLHAALLASTLVVGLFLLVVTVRFVVRHRRKSDAPLTERVASSRRAEAALALFVTVAFVAFWIVGFAQYGAMTAPPADAETIYVEAKQWMWKFSYADGRSTNDVLTVPAGRPIKLVLTSRDVVHSFYVPAFRAKQDVLPGRFTVTWFNATTPGTYPIWCAEYCGVSHAAMFGSVVVVPTADYDTWRRSGPGEDAIARGREVATRRGCVACHSLDGGPAAGPTLRGLYGAARPLADGRIVVADDAYLARAIVEPNADVVAGFQPTMPTYHGILEPAEVGALVELMRGLR
ncbi:MAG: cytochrome c oxidase subunit II [Labilithrix sp.]|nr:cytochrome c oxidase subunit II [Labilithrix sp.]MCW5815678.1 cytochrome c oxidase subunit II [Labilithrix sp.]